MSGKELLQNISLISAFRLLTTGWINDETLRDYADYLVTKPQNILKSSEILKATTTGSDIHLVASILEMT